MVKQEDLELETSLLRAMAVEENYTKYIKHIDFKRVLPNTKTLLSFYEKYYNLYPDHTCIDWGDLYTLLAESSLEQSDLEYYRDYVIPTVRDSRTENTDVIIKGLAQKQCVDEIIKSIHDKFDVSKITEILNTFVAKQDIGLDDGVETADTIDLDVLDKAHGVPWFLPSLQNSLMSMTPGQFIIVSADSGTGKSAFVISQAVHAFKWSSKMEHPRPVLYFNSEGTSGDVLGRFFSNLYKDKVYGGFEEIVDRRKEIKDSFLKNFDSKLFQVVQMANCNTFYKLEKKVKSIKPCLVIIDICDKLAGDEDTRALKKLYDDFRVLSVECPIIGTSQSGDTSYYDEESGESKNRKWLGASKIYGSKSGKQGAADTIITIGKEDEYSNLRYVAVPKKKRGEQTRTTCLLEEKYSLYKQLDI